MARVAGYSSGRRTILQIVLFLVFLGTVGLASLVARYKIKSLELRLGPPVAFDGLEVRVPLRWNVQLPRAGAGTLYLVATETVASPDQRPRILTIAREQVEDPSPPLEYLLTSGLMPTEYQTSAGGQGKLDLSGTCDVGGVRGLLYAGLRTVRVPGSNSPIPKKDIYATATLGTRDVLTVKLEGVGAPNDEDLGLVKMVAEGLAIERRNPQAPATQQSTVSLPNGPTVDVPPGYTVFEESDPLRTERHLVLSNPPRQWSCITLIPCVFFGDEGEVGFRTMLASRDPEWLRAEKVGKSGPHWIADLSVRAGLNFPRRAYLLVSASGSGHALLAILHGASPADTADWGNALNLILKSVTDWKGQPPIELLKAGRAEANRLRQLGLPSLLDGVPADQWWAWSFRSRPFGWNHVKFSVSDARIDGGNECRLLRPDRSIDIAYGFETAPDLSGHRDQVLTRGVLSPQYNITMLDQRAVVANGKYAVRCNPGLGKTIEVTTQLPEEFIPGIYLTLAASKLSRTPMIVRTDRVPGYEGLASLAPMNVIIRPATRAATRPTTTTTLPTTTDAAGIVLEVSGSGKAVLISDRQQIFPGGQMRTLATKDDVTRLFSPLPTMTPPD